jgi:ER degradation enhancer, mannosidase alpha-like 2
MMWPPSSSMALLLILVVVAVAAHKGGHYHRRHPPAYNASYKANLQIRVAENFEHAYVSYMRHAFPKDELKPLSCSGTDHFGGYSVTLIDALDTLAVMGFKEEFWNQVDYVVDTVRFDAPRHVSVFETTIRVLGGLLSAHAMALQLVDEQAAYVALGNPRPNWGVKAVAYNGGLLRRASEIADRMMTAFDTPTGIPFNEVHLCSGVDRNKGHTTCAAAAGTLLLEFGTLAAWTGNCTYLTVAKRALDGIWKHRGKNHLVGTMIDILSGAWVLPEAHIGASIDSFYEYLVKAYILFGQQDYYDKWVTGSRAIHKYTYHDGWFLSSSTESVNGGVVGDEGDYKFNSLQAFWPGLQVLAGDVTAALDSYVKMHCIVRDWGALPEYVPLMPYTRHQLLGKVGPGFPLRPEFLESTFFLYEATGDDHFLHVAEKFLEMIESTKQRCGFAAVLDVSSWTFEDKMDSFLLAETFKYLYLVFQPSPKEMRGLRRVGVEPQLPTLGTIVFNTEAHPIPVTAKTQSVFAQCARHEDLFYLGHNNLQKLSESYSAHDEHTYVNVGSGSDKMSSSFFRSAAYRRTAPHERGLLPDAPASIAMCPVINYMETVAPYIDLIFYNRDRCYDPIPAMTLGHKRDTNHRVNRNSIQQRHPTAAPSSEFHVGGSATSSVRMQELAVEVPSDDTLPWSVPHLFLFTIVIPGDQTAPSMQLREGVVVLSDFPASIDSLYLPDNAVIAQAPSYVVGSSGGSVRAGPPPGFLITPAVYNPQELCSLNSAASSGSGGGGTTPGTDGENAFALFRDAPWYVLRGDGCSATAYTSFVAAHAAQKQEEYEVAHESSMLNSLRSLSGLRKKQKKSVAVHTSSTLTASSGIASSPPVERFGIAVARGSCTFKEKTKLAEDLGAAFVIVVSPGAVLVSMADGGPLEGALYTPAIPTYMMTDRDLEFFSTTSPAAEAGSIAVPEWASRRLAPITLLCTLTAKAQLKATGIQVRQLVLPSTASANGARDTQPSLTVLLYRDRLESAADLVAEAIISEAVALKQRNQQQRGSVPSPPASGN